MKKTKRPVTRRRTSPPGTSRKNPKPRKLRSISFALNGQRFVVVKAADGRWDYGLASAAAMMRGGDKGTFPSAKAAVAHARRTHGGTAPRVNPADVQAEIAQATKLFTDFRGAQPVEVRRLAVPSLPRVALTVGELFGIMYRTERDGRLENYLHRFRKSARPILAVSPDGRTLLILGGDYRVTDRGIEDAA
jgi:hypothetical protein